MSSLQQMLSTRVKMHIRHPPAFMCGLWLCFCFHIIVAAQTFFWLRGDGDCGEVVDDIVKCPSLLHVLLQHGHAVFDEDLEHSGREGKGASAHYGLWKMTVSDYWRQSSIGPFILASCSTETSLNNESLPVPARSTGWHFLDVEPGGTFQPAVLCLAHRRAGAWHNDEYACTHAHGNWFGRPNKAAEGRGELVYDAT